MHESYGTNFMLSSLAFVSSRYLEVRGSCSLDRRSGACSLDISAPRTNHMVSLPVLISSLFWGFKALQGFDGCSGTCSLDVSTPGTEFKFSLVTFVSSRFLEVKIPRGFHGFPGACGTSKPQARRLRSRCWPISSLFWGFKAFYGFEGCSGDRSLDASAPGTKFTSLVWLSSLHCLEIRNFCRL